MRIGYKPNGFLADKRNREHWNALELSITGSHTIATVTHWTGRRVCSASTKEWAIQKFLYNYTDLAALKIVGQVIGEFSFLSPHLLCSKFVVLRGRGLLSNESLHA